MAAPGHAHGEPEQWRTYQPADQGEVPINAIKVMVVADYVRTYGVASQLVAQVLNTGVLASADKQQACSDLQDPRLGRGMLLWAAGGSPPARVRA
jgi:hypothetical protein